MALQATSSYLPITLPGAVTALAPSCSEVTFKVEAAANNTLFVDIPGPENGTAVVDYINKAILSGSAPNNGTTLVADTFTLNGIYCQPGGNTAHPKDEEAVLQILLHGGTYNRTYWTGLDLPDTDIYNWPLAATRAGYHTLALDKLGAGTSPQRPGPLNVVQASLEVEIFHQIIDTIRRHPSASPLGRTYNRVALVGHSLGSVLGATLARLHPSDIDALVATGLSTSIDMVSFLETDFQPAAAVFGPARASTRDLPPGYLTTGSAAARERALYAGSAYDAARLPPRDFAGADAATGGELLTLGSAMVPAPGFARPVLSVVGQLDGQQCPPAAGACEDILAATGRTLWPNAAPFNYYVAPNTGHCLALHYSAPETAAVVHAWLDGVFKA
ncbi:WD domain-containing protein [Apiospora arundinis]